MLLILLLLGTFGFNAEILKYEARAEELEIRNIKYK